ncbi:MAG TPA: diphosphate--fructose-6-phosphate 1-phosphotransferase [Chloroflexota bacterium]|nr:diphosphate--fructose-6-phosphate 1-phosphotransferase [Chloroflexota bacterium]
MATAQPALLVAQSGGPTPVMNASLAGVVEQANLSGIPRVLGARYGIQGVLQRDLIDLKAQPTAVWSRLRRTPSAALGSCRRKLSAEDRQSVLDTLIELQVRYFLYIGGNDSADTAMALDRTARAAGYDLRVVSIPKTIDNDLPGTDHCPGYGSAARFIAQSTQDAGLDTEAMRLSDPIKLIEVMGRDAGWLVAAATLGKLDEAHAPHLICVPERPLDIDAFLGAVESTYRRYGFAVAVVAETIRDREGRPLGTANEVLAADAFGHLNLAGGAATLTALIGRRLGIRARFDKPGTLQRMSMALASPVDLDEAYSAGGRAVLYAVEGRSGCMVAFTRAVGGPYHCEMTAVDLGLVANQQRILPADFLDSGPFSISPRFQDYALPLIGGPIEAYPRLL